LARPSRRRLERSSERQREIALEIFNAAVAGALPGPATAAALQAPPYLFPDISDQLRAAASVWIIALGKAAHPMAAAAADWLRGNRNLEGGLVVSTHDQRPPFPTIDAFVGDHPIPRAASFHAAARVADTVALVSEHDFVLVLLSGGTTSLVGAPVEGVTAEDLSALYEMLLGSGLDIIAMNGVRKRFARWGAGRLAAALPCPVLCLAVSDVIGDDLAAIGSGPCVPDVLTAADVRRLIHEGGLGGRIPPSCEAYLRSVEEGLSAETPKPDHPSFARAQTRVIGGSELATVAPTREAARLGFEVHGSLEPISGDAAECGRTLAKTLLATRPGIGRDMHPVCRIWHGETTVRLDGSRELGGRCQELALAAAEVLRGSPLRVTLVAAGTDGRDGPTDAAGACVDPTTWDAMIRAGIDPADALRRHASHRALDAVGALIRTGPTGTNVGDVVIGIIE
jgi:hydroxypyruvate reductase